MKSIESILFASDVGAERVLGGAERVLRQEALGFAQRGVRVGIVRKHRCLARGSYAGISARGYPAAPLLFAFPRCLAAFRELQREIQPKLLLGHQPFTAFPIFWKASEPKAYFYLSSWPLEVPLRRKPLFGELSVLRFLEKSVLRRAQIIFTASHHALRELLALYPEISPEQVVVNWLGADSQRFAPLSVAEKKKRRRELSLPENSFLYLTVRNLVPRMGLHLLLDAFQLLPKAVRKKCFLLIAGDGPLYGELSKRVRRELPGLAAIYPVYGRGTPLFPHRVIPLGDCFVLPTQALENFGLVIPEAWAAGVPVLGTPVGAIPEVLGFFGKEFLCRSVSAKALSEKMEEVFLSRRDLKNIGARGRALVQKHFTWERHLERLERSLERLV